MGESGGEKKRASWGDESDRVSDSEWGARSEGSEGNIRRAEGSSRGLTRKEEDKRATRSDTETVGMKSQNKTNKGVSSIKEGVRLEWRGDLALLGRKLAMAPGWDEEEVVVQSVRGNSDMSLGNEQSTVWAQVGR